MLSSTAPHFSTFPPPLATIAVFSHSPATVSILFLSPATVAVLSPSLTINENAINENAPENAINVPPWRNIDSILRSTNTAQTREGNPPLIPPPLP